MGESNRTVVRRVFTQVPVTALAFLRNGGGPSYEDDGDDVGVLQVLAGEDAVLRAYHARTGAVLWHRQVFESQPIHGLDVRQTPESVTVLVWGSSFVALLKAGHARGLSASTIRVASAPDWIYAGVICPFGDNVKNVAALVTAHNEVVRLHWDGSLDDAGELVFDKEVISPSRPILYSAHLTWADRQTVLVAAGTVFGEILLWRCHFQSDNGVHESNCEQQQQHRHPYEVLFVLSGHEGSIFGVDISPLLQLNDGSMARFLASCSDDRTVRIWDITDRMGVAVANNSDDVVHRDTRPLQQAPRETGFNSTPGSVAAAVTSTSGGSHHQPVAVAMGHASRIWGVRFGVQAGNRAGEERKISAVNASGLAVYSFGEDSTTQRWRLELPFFGMGEEDAALSLKGKLRHEQTFALHDGKHLWSHAMTTWKNQRVIATGGADGKISIIADDTFTTTTTATTEVGSWSSHNLNNCTVGVDIGDILGHEPPLASRRADRESISRYEFIDQDHVLVITSFGGAFVGYLRDQSAPMFTWGRVKASQDVEEKLKQCYTLRRAEPGIVFVGTIGGDVYCYGRSLGFVHVANVQGRIIDMTTLRSDATGLDSKSLVSVLTHILGTSSKVLITIERQTGHVVGLEHINALHDKFVAVSAARVGDGLLFVGSRHGWLSVLKKSGETYASILDFATPSRDAITAIVPVPHRLNAPSTAPLYVLLTSRDGKARIYEVATLQNGAATLYLRHESSPPLGPMIEGAWFTSGPSPELVLYGFRSKAFVVWNESCQETIANVECGTHRTFRLYQTSSAASVIRLAYSKASQFRIYTKDRPMHHTIRQGTHGREIRAISSNGRYIATGAEDTSVRIWGHQFLGPDGEPDECPPLRRLASMTAHVAGIQRLKWHGEDLLFSSAGNEEFFVTRVRALDAAYSGLGLVRVGVLTDKSPDGDLRITDFDVADSVPVPRERSDGGVGDDRGSGSLLVTMALSNSSLKTYLFDVEGGFRLRASGSYTGACLTQARHLDTGHDRQVTTVLSASTDGSIALWKSREKRRTGDSYDDDDEVQEYVLLQVIRVHQSCIKGLDLLQQSNGAVILTGGDDNALGMTEVIKQPQGAGEDKYRLSPPRLAPRTHAAAINAVGVRRVEGGALVGISTSNDQRLKIWSLPSSLLSSSTSSASASASSPMAVAAEAVKLKLLADMCSGVADPGDVELVRRRGQRGITIAVGGVGFELWDLETDGSLRRGT